MDNESPNKKLKTSNAQTKRHDYLDYYENLSTFENVLELIEDEHCENSKQEENAYKESGRDEGNNIDELFEKFMNSTSEIDLKPPACTKQEGESAKLSLKNEKSQITSQADNMLSEPNLRNRFSKATFECTTNIPCTSKSDVNVQDKYDKLLDDLFD